ncbi:MAG: methyltransferase [Anaerolineae bacterium]|nr:methyltransferase [Anaerolineae bacterium]
MTKPTDYSFTRYLAAKKSVDDRALNRHVGESLRQALRPTTMETPLQVLEIGAGIGTMIERTLDWNLLIHATYTAIDAESDNIAEARRRLPDWGNKEGFAVTDDEQRIRLQREGQEVTVILEAIDLFDFMTRERGQRTWDLLIAHAFVDLVDVPATLPRLLFLLRPGGLLYFTIVFDGVTILQPDINPAFDAHIERLYHQTMDERLVNGRPSGDSQSGRHLFQHLQAAGVKLLDAGSSDWVVFPGPQGYPADEAYFLHFIIHTMHTALTGYPDLDEDRFNHWIARRHAQIEQGSLVFIVHQLDFLGRKPPPGNRGSR